MKATFSAEASKLRPYRADACDPNPEDDLAEDTGSQVQAGLARREASGRGDTADSDGGPVQAVRELAVSAQDKLREAS